MPYKDKEKMREYQREWQKKNRHRYKKRINEYNAERKRKATKYVRELKQNSKCEICGEDRWYCLDFHHKDGKDNTNDSISRMLNTRRSLKTIKAEIEKCIIVCSNCHREIHHVERY
jgi:hypothetical protein